MATDQSTSLTLLERARDQNQEAWGQLFYLYSPLVELWCRAWNVRGADVDDIRQEVFQAVARGLETFRRDRPGDTFRGWLRVITQRKYLDHCRRKGRQPTAEGGSGAHEQMLQVPDAADQTDPPEAVSDLHHRALALIRNQFEERTWQAFWRAAVDGEAPADVGQAMGISAAAVRQAKSRVLRRLKEELGDLLG